MIRQITHLVLGLLLVHTVWSIDTCLLTSMSNTNSYSLNGTADVVSSISISSGLASTLTGSVARLKVNLQYDVRNNLIVKLVRNSALTMNLFDNDVGCSEEAYSDVTFAPATFLYDTSKRTGAAGAIDQCGTGNQACNQGSDIYCADIRNSYLSVGLDGLWSLLIQRPNTLMEESGVGELSSWTIEFYGACPTTTTPTTTISTVSASTTVISTSTSTTYITASPNGWKQLGESIDGKASSDRSGYSVSLSADGMIVAIGADGNSDNGTSSGHIRVYEWNTTTWVQRGYDIVGEAAYDNSGYSVSLSADGSVVAIGAPYNDGNGSISNSGHVRVYEWNSVAWVQRGIDIDGEASNDASGLSVSISGDGTIVAIGAPYNNYNESVSDSGHVRVYEWDSAKWIQRGSDLDGDASHSHNGRSVSLSKNGMVVAIGAPYSNGNGASSGRVRVYEWNSVEWIQRGNSIDGEAGGDFSGHSVSLSDNGTVLAIGSPYHDGPGLPDSGHVRIFEWNLTTWIQRGSAITGESWVDYSGWAVSLSADGATVAIGAKGNNGNGGFYNGHVRVYKWDSNTWIQRGGDIDGLTRDDQFGSSVSLSADGCTVAIGAHRSATFRGQTRIFKCDLVSTTSAVTTYSNTTTVHTTTVVHTTTLPASISFGDSAGTWTKNRTFGSGGYHKGVWSPDGSVVAIANTQTLSGRGSVYIYNTSNTHWVQCAIINGTQSQETSGISVALSFDGSIVAVGSQEYDLVGRISAGRVRVFKRNAMTSEYEQMGSDLYGTTDDGNYGRSVSLSYDGQTIAIGATTSHSLSIFRWDTTAWTQLGATIDMSFLNVTGNYITAELSADGNTLTANLKSDYWCHIVSYVWNSTTWNTRMQISSECESYFLSMSTTSDGDTIVVGYPGDSNNNRTQNGVVRVFARDSNSSDWVQRGSDIVGPGERQKCGYSVSVVPTGSVLAVGCTYYNGIKLGIVYTYEWDDDSSDWVQRHEVTGDNYGTMVFYVSLSPDASTMIISDLGNNVDVYQYSVVTTVPSTTAEIPTTKAVLTTAEPTTTTNATTTVLAVSSSTVPTTAIPSTTTSTTTSSSTAVPTTTAPRRPILQQVGERLGGDTADNNTVEERGGSAVSVSGDGSILAVGAPNWARTIGRVYVYNQTANIQNRTVLQGSVERRQFGQSVSVSTDGRTIAVGHLSGASMFTRTQDGWQRTELMDIESENNGCTSLSLSADGTVVACGNSQTNNRGSVRLFSRESNSSSWMQLGADILGTDVGENTGQSVSLSNDGTVVAVGSTYKDSNGTRPGLTRVYALEEDSWVQVGQVLNGTANGDWSGHSVAISGNGTLVAVGAPKYSENANSTARDGRVSVYELVGSDWQVVTRIGGQSGGNTGWSVSLSDDGGTLAVGSPFARGRNSSYTGSVVVYTRNDSMEYQAGSEIFGESEDDLSGWSVSLSDTGTTVLLGEPSEDTGGARVFSFSVVAEVTESTVSVTTDTTTIVPETTQSPISDSDDTNSVMIIAGAVIGGVICVGLAVVFIVRRIHPHAYSFI